jgi:DNA-binding NarL/FixJ family response regulator
MAITFFVWGTSYSPTVGVRRNGMTMTSYFPMVDALTSREREITGLASTGLSNKEIARHLNRSEGTVKIHLHNILRKLRLSNRTALAAMLFNRSRR